MTDLARMKKFVDEMTPEQARDFLERAGLLEFTKWTRLERDEYDKIWNLVLLIDKPDEVSNNQRTITEVYNIGRRVYNVTYGLEDNPVIEVYKDEKPLLDL